MATAQPDTVENEEVKPFDAIRAMIKNDIKETKERMDTTDEELDEDEENLEKWKNLEVKDETPQETENKGISDP